MRLYVLTSANHIDYDVETVLDAGYPYSSLAKAQAAAQAEALDEAEDLSLPTELAWAATISNLSTWQATLTETGTIWRIRECELDR